MKGKAVVIGLIVGLAVVLLVYFFNNNNNKSTKYQWYQGYRADSNQPYGTLFIQKMLASYHTGKFTLSLKEPVHKVLDGDFSDGNTDYVLIGQSIHLDDADVAALHKFIENGNDVFIATLDAPTSLVNSVYTNYCEASFSYDYNLDTAVYANFYHESLRKTKDYEFRYRVGSEEYPYLWRSLDRSALCDSTVAFSALGYQQGDRVNFVKIPYGSGNLYLHTSPLMFTNYFMTREDKVEYASSVFSHLSGENIIWDEVSKVPFSELDNPYDSPLYYIMQQPALKYAWWMLIAAGILYIIFASKRTQRVIPVLEAKTNTSLEFLNVISSLHYQNPDHLDMARKKMKYFLYFIRARYGINTQHLTDEQAKRLSEKAKVDINDVVLIQQRYKTLENYAGVSDGDAERLVDLYQAIDKFYKNCK
jgi:hypothetical protein